MIKSALGYRNQYGPPSCGFAPQYYRSQKRSPESFGLLCIKVINDVMLPQSVEIFVEGFLCIFKYTFTVEGGNDFRRWGLRLKIFAGCSLTLS